MSDRIPCCVPFCRRTASLAKFPDAGEIICGKHYRLSSAVLRRRFRKIRRRIERGPLKGDTMATLERLERLDLALWTRIKAQAIERAAGL
jgi:hypothetical protein